MTPRDGYAGFRWWFEPSEWQAFASRRTRESFVLQMPAATKAPLGFAPSVPSRIEIPQARRIRPDTEGAA